MYQLLKKLSTTLIWTPFLLFQRCWIYLTGSNPYRFFDFFNTTTVGIHQLNTLFNRLIAFTLRLGAMRLLNEKFNCLILRIRLLNSNKIQRGLVHVEKFQLVEYQMSASYRNMCWNVKRENDERVNSHVKYMEKRFVATRTIG